MRKKKFVIVIVEYFDYKSVSKNADVMNEDLVIRRVIMLGYLDIIQTAKQFKATLKLEPIITAYMH